MLPKRPINLNEGIMDEILGGLGIPGQEIGDLYADPECSAYNLSTAPGSTRTLRPSQSSLPWVPAVVPLRCPAHRLDFGRSLEHAESTHPSRS
jgi:hypothetical protein